MKYRLKNYYTKKNYYLPDDYCEICMPEGYSVDPYYVFVDENGNEHEIGAFDWEGPHGYNSVDLDDGNGKLERFSEWLKETDLKTPEEYNYDWFLDVYMKFFDHEEWTDERKEKVQQWVNENVVVNGNKVHVNYRENDLIPVVEETLSFFSFAGVRVPENRKFKATENDLINFINNAEYVSFDFFVDENDNLILSFIEYNELEKPILRDDDSDMTIVKNAPGIVTFELNENDDFPLITIQ